MNAAGGWSDRVVTGEEAGVSGDPIEAMGFDDMLLRELAAEVERQGGEKET